MSSRFSLCVGRKVASWVSALAGCGLLAFGVPAVAQGSYAMPSTAVGTTSATQTVTVNVNTSGTVARIDVLTQGASGLDYAQVSGGTCAVAAVLTAPTSCTVNVTFTPTRPWTRYGSVTLSDASGNVLGNTYLNGVGTSPLVAYPLGASSPSTALGSGFSGPAGVVVDGSGDVFVADTANNAIKEIVVVGGTIPASPTINVWNTGFSGPTGLAIDGSGNLFVADTGNNAVKEMIAVGGVIPASPTIVSLGSGFSSPMGVAVDQNGNLFIADTANNAIDEIAATQGVISPTATPTTIVSTGLAMPKGLAFDSAGNLYVADSGNGAIKELMATSGTVGANPTVNTVASGFTSPAQIAIDGSGNLYVADTGNNAVKEVLASGGTIPASPTIVTLGSGFSAPQGVAVDPNFNVYVADTGNNAVDELNAQTAPSIAFGSAAVGTTSADSPKSATLANFGNAALVFPVPGTGTNPSVSSNFNIASGTTCPTVHSTDTTAGQLAAGSSCMESVNFAPTQAGAITGSVTFTDNNLNQTAATQAFGLSGTGTAGTPTITPAPATAVVNASSVTLTASLAFGGVAPTGAVSFTVNGGSAVAATCTGTTSPETCTATYNPAGLTVGSYPIVATIAADSNYNSASGSSTLSIQQGTPTITLTGPGSASTVNAPVTFTASMTPTSGVTPTGPVTFTSTLNGTTTPIPNCSAVPVTASGGTVTATCPTRALGLGSNSVVATLAADTNFVSATSNSVTQQVNISPSTLTLSTPPSSAVDSPVTITATVGGPNGVTPFAPGGTVSFTANGSPIAGCTNVPVNATTHAATCTTNTLIVPADQLGASYSGDTNFQPSMATATTAVVTKNSPTVSVTSSLPSGSVVNQSVAFTATVTPAGSPAGGIAPTGSVTFTVGGTQICPPVVVTPNSSAGTASATCTTSFSNVSSGTTVTATYSGDANFNPGTPGSVTQVITAAPTTTTVSANPSTVGVNQSVPLNVTVTPANSGSGYGGSATPQSGTITFTDSVNPGTPFCTATLSGGVVTSPCSFSSATLGQHNITANFTSTDSNFTGSTSTPFTITVGTSSLNITLSPATAPTGVAVNQSTTYSVTFSNYPSGQTTSPGTITYFDNGTAINACKNLVISAAGAIPSCTYTFLTAGPHPISATFTPASGSSFSALTTNTTTQVITQNSPTVSLTSNLPSGSVVNQAVTFTATVTPANLPPGGVAPTGSITFSIGGTAICPPVVVTPNSSTGTATASCTTSFSAVSSGTVVTATYSGDANFNSGTPGTFSQVITAAPTTTTVSANPSTVGVNQSSALSVSVVPTHSGSGYPGNATPQSGTIMYTDSVNPGTPFCTSTLVAGVVTSPCSFSSATLGQHSITATFTSSDSNFGNSTSSPVTITVGTSSLNLNLSPATAPTGVAVNQSATFTVAFSNFPSGQTTSPGTVTFFDNGTVINACKNLTVSTAGVVPSCTYTFLTAGQHPISAVFTPAGGSSFPALTSNTTTAVITQNSPTVSLTSNLPSGSVVNQSVTFTATVTPAALPAGGVAPTGSITFSIGGTPICPPVVVTPNSTTGTAAASCTTSFSAVSSGTVVTATYSGDANFNSGTPGTFSQVITAAPTTTAVSANPSTVGVNQSAPLTVSVVPTNSGSGYPGSATPQSGTIAFTDSVSPGAPFCTATLVAGVVTTPCSFSSATLGQHGITATFTSSDSNFGNSTSSPFTITVGTSSLNITLSPATAPTGVAVNQSATFSVTFSNFPSGQTTSPGTVTFFDNGTAINACKNLVVSTTGVVPNCSYTFLTAGQHPISAVFTPAGGSSFPTLTTNTTTTVITKNSPTVSLTSNLTSGSVVNQAVTFTATVTPAALPAGGIAPTGSITFTIGGNPICPPVVVTPNSSTGTATASCTTSFSAVSSGTLVTATYSGDANFNPGTAGTFTQVITAAPTTTVVSASSATVGVNQPLALNVNVSATNSGSGYPGTATPQNGTITFVDSVNPGIVFCTTHLLAGVVQSPCSFSSGVLGVHNITATFTSTDSNFSSSTSTAFTVTVGTSTLGLNLSPAASPNGVTVNQSTTFSVAFSNFPTGLSASPGTVTYLDGSNGIAGCTNLPVSTSGIVPTCTYTFLTSGQHPISAVFTPASGSSFPGLTSNVTAVNIGATAVTVKFTAPSGTSTTDQPVTFAATVTAGSGGTTAPTGTVTFTYQIFGGNSTIACQPTVSTTAGVTSASCTAPLPAAGTYTLTASYSGDSNFSSGSTTMTQVVGMTSTTVALALPSNPTVDTPGTYTATVSVAGSISDTGLTVPSGTVTFTDSANGAGVPGCSAVPISVAGVASCTYSPNSAGTRTITAKYNGDANFGPSSAAPSVTVAQETPTLTLSGPTSAVASQAVTFTATINFPSVTPTLPTNLQVQFTLPTGYSCTSKQGSTSNIWTCTVVLSNATAGPFPVTAAYLGDSNFAPANATFTPVLNVANFTPTVTAKTGSTTLSSVTVTQGGSTASDAFTPQTITIGATALSGFSDTLQIQSCTVTSGTNPATGVTCTWTPTSGGSAVIGSQTITVSATSTAPLGTYSLNVTVADVNNPALTQVARIPVTVISLGSTVTVPSTSTGTGTFTAAPSQALSCGTNYAVLSNGVYVQHPLSNINVTKCTVGETPIGSGTYTISISAGSLSAQLQTGQGKTFLALLGSPFLLLLAVAPASRRRRKSLLRVMFLLVFGISVVGVTGCSSGGFQRSTGAAGVDGSYLINVVNASGATVAEVPFNIVD